MKKIAVFLIVTVILISMIGCTDTKTREDVRELSKKVDELNKKVNKLEVKTDRLQNAVFPETQQGEIKDTKTDDKSEKVKDEKIEGMK